VRANRTLPLSRSTPWKVALRSTLESRLAPSSKCNKTAMDLTCAWLALRERASPDGRDADISGTEGAAFSAE